MKPLILASKSRARAELLKKCGFKFKIFPSNARELKVLPHHAVKEILIKNALNKAKTVSGYFKKGAVIAADTVVLQGGRIFGKPSNLKDAFLTIKRLSNAPSSVYTGLAVIDIENKKGYVDYCKTKVWLSKLSDKEIKNYLKNSKGRHINFAGGFDIQGRGSLFIERIEGCFYNVVGLPLPKLYKLLKKCGIEI
ncbi:MAG: septum formation protein Maf [Candidatus Omnitrophica bacterium CG11_big_fil_rev_8_21_14_0_20_42_13]|uniref:Nucleoside triphosphate pyrophosphatase n=1 Tax=Candidatus Ghiorseimicrobium undicola TaxID=1974746 RepID=A0A2H0LZI1_9BACT|nr:MAG: septum formation protein Maf [Candidatus Omnitrophica bacterium CG11_big_fil_rev_8_21_14_0_20_42_13]